MKEKREDAMESRKRIKPLENEEYAPKYVVVRRGRGQRP